MPPTPTSACSWPAPPPRSWPPPWSCAGSGPDAGAARPPDRWGPPGSRRRPGRCRLMAPQPKPQKGERPRPAPTGPGIGPAIRTNWAPRLLAAGRWVVAAATGETGRRVARTVALTVVLAVLVTALYEHGEAPRAAAAPAVD